jgi:hypothetical protein
MDQSMVLLLVVANAGGGVAVAVYSRAGLVEGVFIQGWWVFFPLPPFFIVGLLLAVVAPHLLSALSFLLFFCIAFPSTVFHPSFSSGAVVD